MLSLQLKDGEYLTIGEDIVIRVFTNATIRLSVEAPKDMVILRGEVRERGGGERPPCLQFPQPAKTKRRALPPAGAAAPQKHSVSSG